MKNLNFLVLNLFCIISILSSCKSPSIEKVPKNFTVTVPKGATLTELGNTAYSYLKKYSDEFNLGGMKLCSEISADINGIYNSNLIFAGMPLTFYTLDSLGFTMKNLNDDQNNLAARIVNNHVKFLRGRVKDAFTLMYANQIMFDLSLQNMEDYPIDFSIEKGDLIETINPNTNPQNLVVATDIVQTIDPHSTIRLDLPGYCVNKNKTMLGGESVRPTPLFMNPDFCDSQESVWAYFDDLREKYH